MTQCILIVYVHMYSTTLWPVVSDKEYAITRPHHQSRALTVASVQYMYPSILIYLKARQLCCCCNQVITKVQQLCYRADTASNKVAWCMEAFTSPSLFN